MTLSWKKESTFFHGRYAFCGENLVCLIFMRFLICALISEEANTLTFTEKYILENKYVKNSGQLTNVHDFQPAV